MPSTRDIGRRIKSVKNTAQITKAMQLVAAAKMKKAQDQAANGRHYAEMLNKVLVNLKEKAEEGLHPFFSEGKGGKVLVLLVSSDKGLCGALNTNLFKKLITTDFGTDDVDYVTIGKKGVQAINRLRRHLLADFPIKDPAKFAEVRGVGRFLQEKFLTGEYKKVLVVFNNFINTVTVVPTVEQILPVNPVTLGGKRDFAPEIATATATTEYTFEPSAAVVFTPRDFAARARGPSATFSRELKSGALVLAADRERRTTGRDDANARTTRHQLGDIGGRVARMLQIVQQ